MRRWRAPRGGGNRASRALVVAEPNATAQGQFIAGPAAVPALWRPAAARRYRPGDEGDKDEAVAIVAIESLGLTAVPGALR